MAGPVKDLIDIQTGRHLALHEQVMEESQLPPEGAIVRVFFESFDTSPYPPPFSAMITHS